MLQNVIYDKCLFDWSQNLAHEHNEHFCRKSFVSVFPKAAEKVPKLWPTHPSWVSCSRPRTPPAASWPPSAPRPPRSSRTTSARARRSPATPSSRNRWKRTSHTRRWAKSIPWSLLFLLPIQETVPLLLLELDFLRFQDPVVVDGNLVTSRGPGTSFAFGIKLVELVAGSEAAAPLAGAMLL